VQTNFKEQIIQKVLKPLTKTWLGKRIMRLEHEIFHQKLQSSYSQKGEDIIIDKLLKNKKTGFYVDVGANHPTAYNNTYHFYLKRWHGINIEPNKSNIKLFNELRTGDINLNIGIGNKEKTLNFYEFDAHMLSTFSKSEAEKYKKQGYVLKHIEKVPVKKLSTVLEKYSKGKKIDFISIDTEGYDLEVLKSNDWKKFRPKVICIESASFGYEKDYAKVQANFLSKQGYSKAAQTRLNSIYLRDN